MRSRRGLRRVGKQTMAETDLKFKLLSEEASATLERLVAIFKAAGMPPEDECNQFEWLEERLSVAPKAVAWVTPAIAEELLRGGYGISGVYLSPTKDGKFTEPLYSAARKL